MGYFHARNMLLYKHMGEDFQSTTTNISGVTDAERLEASTRQVFIAPIHDDVIADDLPDEVIVTRHLVQPPIGNIPTDSELTDSSPAQQRIDQKNHRFALIVSLVTVAIVTGVSLVAYITVANLS